MKKRLVSLFAVLLVLAALWLPAFAVAEPTADFYVADYAGVLSAELEKKIIDCNGALEQQCDGAQFVVLTVNYLDGMYSDEYAAEVFREWGIGDAEENNGVLLLLAVQENKGWLMAGYGIQSRFDADSMMDGKFWKSFDNGKYDEAVGRVMNDVLDWFDDNYGTDILSDYEAYLEDTGASEYSGSGENEKGDGFSTFIGVIIFIVVMFFILRAAVRIIAAILRFLFGGGGRGGRGGGGGGFWPWFFIGRSVGRNSGYRPGGWSSGGHSGGFGGGHSGGFGGGHSGGFGGGHSGGFGGGMGHGGGGFGGGGGAGRR